MRSFWRIFVLACAALSAAASARADESQIADTFKLTQPPAIADDKRTETATPRAATQPMPLRSRIGLSVPALEAGDPLLGLELADSIDPFLAAIGLTGESGALIFGVDRNGPAARAGFLPGDLIVAVAGNRVRDANTLKWMLRDLDAAPVEAELIRVGRGPADLIEQLRRTAAGGNRDAVLALGDAALFNLDGSGRRAAAEEYYLRAYAMGDARAAYRLGSMYAAGRGVAIDLAVATRWYRLAADAQLPAGLHALGVTWWTGRYWTGVSLEGDYDEAVRLLALAAARGYAPSYAYLGLANQYGYGTETDYPRALEWYEKAIDTGDVDAMFRRAEMVEAGQGVDADPARALTLYREAAAAGSVDANRRLGEKYWRGDGVVQHPLNALTYFEAAANAGDRGAMTMLAQILLSGYGVTRDPEAAVGWYFKAYRAGDPEAGYALALAYADGVGVPPDLGKVAPFMLEAIRRGSRAALGEMKGNAESWDQLVREDLQELLEAHGYYQGEIDGVFGPGTLRAIDAAAAGGAD